MAFFDLFPGGRLPDDIVGATLVVAEAETLLCAEPFLTRLAAQCGRLALGVIGRARYTGTRPQIFLSEGAGAHRRLAKIAPARIVFIGRAGARFDLARSASCPVYWVNAEDPQVIACAARATLARPELQSLLPGAVVTGDPLLAVAPNPAAAQNPAFCERFREFRDRGQWVIYFAATGEQEEPLAYASLFQLLRQKAGLMALAPRDPARYEPVYREAIPYRLPTNRHVRLITSFVPYKTRVYYIEDAAALESMYQCADVVIAGGTLHEAAHDAPDLSTPLHAGRATLVGPAHRTPVVAAAIAAGAALPVAGVEDMVRTIDMLLADPGQRAALGKRGRAWLQIHAGATERVLALITE